MVAAYKGGSKDIESSIARVDQFAEEIHAKWGVEIVPDIATLLSKVDAVLLDQRGWPRPPGAGAARDRRAQAAVHR